MNKKVNSVSEYLSYIESIDPQTVSPTFETTTRAACLTFYRGQANAAWKLIPSLYRQDLFNVESLLLQELKHICPTEFEGNRFDILVKMQHFGLPTRLLDTTTNPLVALYFACKEPNEKDSDGVVYVFPNLSALWSTNAIIDLVMDYVFGDILQKVPYQTMRQIYDKYAPLLYLDTQDKYHQFIYKRLACPIMAVIPAKTNQRIEAQDGTFFIYGMTCQEVKDKESKILQYEFAPTNIDCVTNYIMKCGKTKEVIIPQTAKNNILKQLDILGINEHKLFPDLSHQIKYTVDFIKNSCHEGLR